MNWYLAKQIAGDIAALLIYGIGLVLYFEQQFAAASANFTMACFILLINRPVNK